MNREDILSLKKAADKIITELAVINKAMEKTQEKIVNAIDLSIKLSRYLALELEEESQQ